MPPDPAIRPAGALLAGGSSRRMGTDKALLELDGRPMFRHAAEALAWTEPRVQAGGAPLPGLGWPVVADARPEAGPAAALEALLGRDRSRPVVVCAADLPFVDAELLRTGWRMAVEAAEVDPRIAAAAPRHRGRWHPLAATWMPAALEPIVRWLDAGHRRLQELLDQLPVVAIEGELLASLGDPERLLTNVNDAADLRAARMIAAPD